MISEQEALQILLDETGHEDEIKFAEEFVPDSIVPAICLKCEIVDDNREPDTYGGPCHACGDKSSVKGGLVLMGVL